MTQESPAKESLGELPGTAIFKAIIGLESF